MNDDDDDELPLPEVNNTKLVNSQAFSNKSH